MKKEWLKENWFKVGILLVLAVGIFMLSSNSDTYKDNRKAECLILMKTFEAMNDEYERFIKSPELTNKNEEEKKEILDKKTIKMLKDVEYSQEEFRECWGFLEVENVDYSLRTEI